MTKEPKHSKIFSFGAKTIILVVVLLFFLRLNRQIVHFMQYVAFETSFWLLRCLRIWNFDG